MSINSNSNEYDAMDLPKMQETIQRINFASGKPAEEALKKILESALKKGIMPKTALQLHDDVMEAIYTQGYNLYNQGKYKEASYIFHLLMLLDFSTSKYVLGVAACAHRLKDYTNAANLYLLCAALDPKNPLPHFHAADCYLQLGAQALALFSINMAISTAADQPQYSVVRERARLMQGALRKQIEEAAQTKEKEEAKKKE